MFVGAKALQNFSTYEFVYELAIRPSDHTRKLLFDARAPPLIYILEYTLIDKTKPNQGDFFLVSLNFFVCEKSSFRCVIDPQTSCSRGVYARRGVRASQKGVYGDPCLYFSNVGFGNSPEFEV